MPYRLTGRPHGRTRKAWWANKTRTKPNLTAKQWEALTYEFSRLNETLFLDTQPLPHMKKFPSRLTAGQVARIVGVSRQIIQRWRRDPRYCKGIIYLYAQTMPQRRVKDRQPVQAPSASPPRFGEIGGERYFVELCFKIQNAWPQGGLLCPVTNQWFNDPNEYAHHLFTKGYDLVETLPPGVDPDVQTAD